MCKKLMLLISLVLVLGLVDSVSAGDIYWWDDGGTGHSWYTPENWNPNSVPGSLDTVIINSPPYQGPVVDCNVGIDQILGPTFYSDANQVMNFLSGNFKVDVWKLAQSGTGKATINIGGDSNVTLAVGNDYEFGGIHGPTSGDVEINITDNATFTVGYAERGIHLGTSTGTTTVLNISGNAQVRSSGKHAIQLADEGTVIVNISDNASIIHNKWRNGDSADGYVEIHMTGGEITGGYMSISDDGSGIFDFSGGTVEVEGLQLKGRECSSVCEINVSGTADVTAWEAIRLSYGGCGPSTVNVSGGRLHSDWTMEMASGTATSTLNMTGGSLGVGYQLYAPVDVNATSIINLRDGTIECGEFVHGGANWLVDIHKGTMIIDSNVVPEIETDIATGHIIAYGGGITDYVVVDFNNVNPGKTTVWAVKGPPPGDFDKNGVVDWNQWQRFLVLVRNNECFGFWPKQN